MAQPDLTVTLTVTLTPTLALTLTPAVALARTCDAEYTDETTP